MTRTTIDAVLPAERAGFLAGADLTERRAMFAATSVDPSLGVAVGEATYGGVPCRSLTGGDEGTVLYLHGGGYRMGSPEAYFAYCARIAEAAGTTIVLPRYRLAPENPFPAGLRDALSVYEDLALTSARPVVVAGDSAGAGLAAAVVIAVCGSNIRRPGGLMLMSPWLDLRCTSPFYGTATDASFSLEIAESARDDYLQGAPADNPLVSPLLSAPTGFPSTLIQVGGKETLLGDSLSLASALAKANVTCTLKTFADQVHAWPLVDPDHDDAMISIESCATFIRSIA